jgi:transcriptional regulator ATRX
VLVVSPLGSILNWYDEFNKGLPKESGVEVYQMAGVKRKEKSKEMDKRLSMLKRWKASGGVMIIGSDMFRNLTNRRYKKMVSKKMYNGFTSLLVNPGPHLVVLDDLLISEGSALSKAMNKIATRRRVVLTDDSLQNNLLEYHCMIQFVKPNLLGMNVEEFTNRFANPIKNEEDEKLDELLEGEFIVLSILLFNLFYINLLFEYIV